MTLAKRLQRDSRRLLMLSLRIEELETRALEHLFEIVAVHERIGCRFAGLLHCGKQQCVVNQIGLRVDQSGGDERLADRLLFAVANGGLQMRTIGGARLEARQAEADADGGSARIDERRVMTCAVIRETNGRIGGSILVVKEIDRVGRIVAIHLNGTIVQLANGLELDIVAMNAKTSLASNIGGKVFGHELRVMVVFGHHVLDTELTNSVVHVGVTIDLQRDSTKQTIAITLHNRCE
jgi:hypothetical protein